MADSKATPYGSWKSPITSELIASGTTGIGQTAIDGEDVYWVEQRASEGGRSVIVRRAPDGRTSELTPRDFNVRTTVHEYGGGDFAVSEGVVYFSNYADQRLYRQRPGESPSPVTPAMDMRYADGIVDAARNRMVCVREDHTSTWREPVNAVVSVDLRSGAARVLVSGNSFYSSPRISGDGTRLAWLAWNHPNMPWDGTELWMAELDAEGGLGAPVLVAGGPDESIFQPEWSPDGTLYFVSDRSGWWNLHRWRGGQVESVLRMEAEFGVPQWGLGMSTYGFASAGRVICAYNQRGTWHVADLDTEALTLQRVTTPFTEITRSGLRVSSGLVLFGAGSPSMPESLMLHELATGQTETLRSSTDVTVEQGYISSPEAVEFPTGDGLTAHAFFYAPRNQDYATPPGERPPLLVISHGGPTGATSTTLNLGVQYWTSRGFALLDVNYGGSTGYGTEYRRRLNGRWGVVDVDDCANGARFLAARGDVDADRTAIRGGSAGGYTTLSALTFRDVFRAGASYYGISDLAALAEDTHKFESRYLDTMIGPYPEREDLYIERSPIHHTERLSCPIILFQGLEDKVVPPNQAEMMVEALRQKGLPVAYVAFEGEQHGFRSASAIRRALDAELYFYSRVFGFELAEPVEPVPIDNLP